MRPSNSFGPLNRRTSPSSPRTARGPLCGSAPGAYVWDADGRKYLDLTAAFGVAAAGHANSQVVKAGQNQMAKLLHAMGDVHPHRLKAELARALSGIAFERWAKR